MQHRQKCCLHCPGTWITSSPNNREEHSCRLPAYVRGNLKLSSLRKSAPDFTDRAERLRGTRLSSNQRQNEVNFSCYDRFAIAKKFHAENLEHQPLPDRVDDSIFLNARSKNIDGNNRFAGGCEVRNRIGASKFGHKIRGNSQYVPTLGCKVPQTNMDLAICWECPVDDSYEPTRTVHVDGTDGGLAPAIFTRVDRQIPILDTHRNPQKCSRNVVETYEAKFVNVKNRCHCVDDQKNCCNVLQPILRRDDDVATRNLRCHDCPEEENLEEFEKNANGEDSTSRKKRSSCNDLCEKLDSIRIDDRIGGKNSVEKVSSKCDETEKIRPFYSRNCGSCRCRGDRSARKTRDRRLINSACAGTKNFRRNGLPTKINVPRPKTPYAKRSFCIDTLTPPFSIVDGCRDADYPEHWRLTSVYQQSYKNPRKQRPTILNYD